MEINHIDRQILRELQKDSSRPISKIADRVGLSMNACWRRIKQLQNHGIIRKQVMLLDHDAGTIFWEGAFDTAQELSWYIVDAMPWILPQHIRYVGQESSTLTQAMQEKECYLQG